MTSENILSFVGKSGLSEKELLALWDRLRSRFLAAFDALSGPLDEEEERRWDGAIHLVIQETYPNLPSYPDRDHIYSDMKHVRGWERVRAIIKRGQILDHLDYWVARNSPLAFAEQLSASQLNRLQQLVSTYEQAS